MLKIGFIFNPFSGVRRSVNLEQLIIQNIDSTVFEVSIFPTAQGSDIEKFASQMVSDSFDVVVACGGDGTVSRVAGVLAGTKTAMGIVPLGSGNGLARHLKISTKPKEALIQLQHAKIHLSDLAKANGMPFVNVAGLGYDAHISHKFAGKSKRGFWGYAKTVAGELNYKPQRYKITADNSSWEGKAWMVCVLNGAQWGNGVNLFPDASIHDGILHCVIFKKQSVFQMSRFAFRALMKNLHKSSHLEIINAKNFKIETLGNSVPLHLDGEPAGVIDEVLNVEVLSNQLKIIF